MRIQTAVECQLCGGKMGFVDGPGALRACPRCYRFAYKQKLMDDLHNATVMARAEGASVNDVTAAHVSGVCINCGKPFTPRRGAQSYCSRPTCRALRQEAEELLEATKAALAKLAAESPFWKATYQELFPAR